MVVDCGAGTGTLAERHPAGRPDCLTALTYVLVEQSPALRAHHGDHLSLSTPELALGPHLDRRLRRPAGRRGTGPRFVSLDSMPALSIVGVVTANELLDNLPFAVVERDGGEWLEVRVALDADQQALVEQLVPARERLARDAEALVPGAADGAAVPDPARATTWLRNASAQVDRGRVLVIDYASTTPRPRRSTEPTTGSAPTESTSGVRALSTTWGLRTSPSTCASTSWRGCVRPIANRRNRSSSAATAWASWSRRAGGRGTSEPTSAISRRCAAGAASTRPRP